MGEMRHSTFSNPYARAHARTNQPFPDLPPLYRLPPPFHPTSNGGPPLEPRRPGRPPISEEVRERVLELLAEGVPLKQICRTPGLPCNTTVHRWRHADPEFDRQVRQMAQYGRELLLEMVSEQFEQIVQKFPVKIARRWWNLRRRELIRINPVFFGGGPDRSPG